MPCITTDQKTDLQGDLAAALAFIAWIDAGITAASSSGQFAGTRRYDFDSGTGRQSETFSSVGELITARRRESASRDRIRRELNGTSILAGKLRR